MSYLVSCTEDYTGAQLEELANTLYILAVQRDAVGNGDGSGNGDGTPSAPVVTRPLIDEALEEVQAQPGRKLGFRVG